MKRPAPMCRGEEWPDIGGLIETKGTPGGISSRKPGEESRRFINERNFGTTCSVKQGALGGPSVQHLADTKGKINFVTGQRRIKRGWGAALRKTVLKRGAAGHSEKNRGIYFY